MLPLQQAFRIGVAAATLSALAACSGADTETATTDGGDGGHVHEAQFGGTLVPLGDHFANVELTHDAETGEVALYTWGGHAEQSERSSTEAPVLTITDEHSEGGPISLTLAPRVSATSGEKAGDSSKFTGQHDGLKGLDHFDVVITELSVKGTSFKNIEFTHPEGGHDHADGDGHDSDGDGDEENHGDGDDGDDEHNG